MIKVILAISKSLFKMNPNLIDHGVFEESFTDPVQDELIARLRSADG